jgi:hypothetical protein
MKAASCVVAMSSTSIAYDITTPAEACNPPTFDLTLYNNLFQKSARGDDVGPK